MLVEMTIVATTPRMAPITQDPTASGIVVSYLVDKARLAPATVTPNTAAMSSRRTMLTLGSSAWKTEEKMVQQSPTKAKHAQSSFSVRFIPISKKRKFIRSTKWVSAAEITCSRRTGKQTYNCHRELSLTSLDQSASEPFKFTMLLPVKTGATHMTMHPSHS